MQRADGSPVWISLTVNAVRDTQGRVVESRSMVIDIAERKRAGEEIQQRAAQLGGAATSGAADRRTVGPGHPMTGLAKRI